MTASRSDRVLSVADLVGRPGASRRLALEVVPPDDLDRPLLRLEQPVRLEGVLESVVDGILVRGTLSTSVEAQCGRCLKDIVADVETDVVELFRDPAEVDPDDELDAGYEIADARIDLDVLVRDALAPALPYSPVCDEDCKGLCPTCGTDLNEASCDCTDTSTDARWAALEALRLPPTGGDGEDVERGDGGA
ncbi:MAG TPA: DUF177 domain-containing protein [Egibacteraceae bacterium]|nr:DUF177 domain-containing protein [Egibacteraceae bacterium]